MENKDSKIKFKKELVKLCTDYREDDYQGLVDHLERDILSFFRQIEGNTFFKVYDGTTLESRLNLLVKSFEKIVVAKKALFPANENNREFRLCLDGFAKDIKESTKESFIPFSGDDWSDYRFLGVIPGECEFNLLSEETYSKICEVEKDLKESIRVYKWLLNKRNKKNGGTKNFLLEFKLLKVCNLIEISAFKRASLIYKLTNRKNGLLLEVFNEIRVEKEKKPTELRKGRWSNQETQEFLNAYRSSVNKNPTKEFLKDLNTIGEEFLSQIRIKIKKAIVDDLETLIHHQLNKKDHKELIKELNIFLKNYPVDVLSNERKFISDLSHFVGLFCIQKLNYLNLGMELKDETEKFLLTYLEVLTAKNKEPGKVETFEQALTSYMYLDEYRVSFIRESSPNYYKDD